MVYTKNGNEDNVIKAVVAALNKGLSTWCAAELYAIPKSTLSDKLVGVW